MSKKMGQDIRAHYSCDDLISQIDADLKRLGLTRQTVQRDDLRPLDEFHVGGHNATRLFLENMPPLTDRPANHEQAASIKILDIGCGVGGQARYIAEHYGATVTGIDLSPDYINVGNMLNDWVGLASHITLTQASATDLPFADSIFDAAIMMHVGMNISDKQAFADSAFRALRPGGYLGIYDIMKGGTGPTRYPLPWAMNGDMDYACAPTVYEKALETAGFTVTSRLDRTAMALAFFAKLHGFGLAREKSGPPKSGPPKSGPPALGLHILMGPDAPVKFTNVAAQIASGLFAPMEIIAQKPAQP